MHIITHKINLLFQQFEKCQQLRWGVLSTEKKHNKYLIKTYNNVKLHSKDNTAHKNILSVIRRDMKSIIL